MEIHLSRQIEAGETVRGVVRLTEAAYELTFDKSITLEVEGEENIRFTIPVVRRIIP